MTNPSSRSSLSEISCFTEILSKLFFWEIAGFSISPSSGMDKIGFEEFVGCIGIREGGEVVFGRSSTELDVKEL